MAKQTIQSLLEPVLSLIKTVGHEVAVFYYSYQDSAELKIQSKNDDSPVTEVDMLAHRMILAGLNKLAPNIPILSEESTEIPFIQRREWEKYWLIDPLDGTRDFIYQGEDFTINIALIEKNQAVLGLIYSPIKQICYLACQDYGAFNQEKENALLPIKTRKQSGPIKIIASKYHNTAAVKTYLDRLGDHEIINMSGALKFCYVADGQVDLYLRLGPTAEWDTAAGQCIVELAGGKVIDIAGKPLLYNTKESLLNPEFLAFGDPNYKWQDLIIN